MFRNAQEKKWFVAYTYPQAEKKIHTGIQKLGFESFLPLHKVRRQWSDRVKLLEVPLFPSYLFIKTIPGKIQELLNVYGIARFLFFEDKYATISEDEIELIKNITEKNKSVTLLPGLFKAGQKAIINRGPFSGYKGVLVRENGENQFVIALEHLDRSLSVSVPATSISLLQ